MPAYEEALQRLYQVPVASFLAERQRLAAELRAQHDEAGAAQLAKRPKPIASVWVVNQLYWHARDAFVEMLAVASRVRQGDLGATKAYHEAIANLRKRAAIVLTGAGYAASEATLRRVATTLAAIGAGGGFEPDPPGALAADRDPPGFGAVSVPAQPVKNEPPTPPRLRVAEEMERKRREAERARRKAERSRVQIALREATVEVRAREHAVAVLEKQLRAADKAMGDARQVMQDLERKLAELAEGDG